MRFLSFLFFCFITINALLSQTDKSNYALLWEITGQDLAKPSYLFGTMHVRDQRAAEFPDSVLIALEKTEAYAMEIHPDTLVDFYMELFTGNNKENTLKNRLSASAYERLNRAVLEKTGKPIDSLENQDPSFVQLLLMDFDEPTQTAKNDQIVDLYLYKQAWLMGQSIYGLEELKDYNNVTDQFFNMFEKDTYGETDTAALEKAKNEQFEEMVKLYQAGDLAALDAWVKAQSVDADFDKAMLDTRNEKMVKSLEKLAALQPTFFAVGTAHLPGTNGMLELLKNKGYSVRKVQATFNGYAQRFKPKGKAPKWHATRNEIFGYELQTPKPFYDFEELEMPENVDFEVKFQMDMLDMNAFFVMNIGIPGGRQEEADLDKLEEILNDQSEDEERKLVSKKAITHQGVKGGEFKYAADDNNFSLWRIFVRENAVQIFVVFREFDDFSSPNIQQFYDSIQFFKPKKPKIDLEKYTSIAGGYTVEMPGGADYRRVLKKEEEYKQRPSYIHQYLVTNKSTGVYYLMQHSLLTVGTKVNSDQKLLENSFKNLSAKWEQPDKKGQPITYQGLNGLAGDFEVGKDKIQLRLFLRGNRLYLMIIGCPKISDLATFSNEFFNSFNLLSYQQSKLTPSALTAVETKMAFPDATIFEEFKPDEEEGYPTVNEWTFFTMDSLNGYNYIVNVYDFPTYFEVEDTTAFYDNYRTRLAAIEGLESLVDTTFNGGKAWYLRYSSDLHSGVTHSLMFLEGFRVFETNLYAPTGRDDASAWRFFNSFQPIKDYENNYFFLDRSETLLANLQSRDTVVQLTAKEGIDRYSLSTKNLPTIYQILEKEYPYDTLQETTIHDLMFQELLYTSDQTTLPFLAQLYTQKAKQPATQIAILQTLGKLKTKAAYDLYFKLILDFGQKEFEGYIYNPMIAPLRDTLELTAKYYPQIMQLRQNEALRYYGYNLIFNGLQNDALDPQKVAKNRAFFLADAQAIVDKYDLGNAKDTLPYIAEYYHLDALHIILGELPPEEKTQKYLNALLDLPNAKLVTTIIDGLLMQGQLVPTSAFETVFARPYYWKELLTNLKFENNLDKIPSDLLTQKATATAYVYHTLESEYNDLTSFKILDKRIYKEGETSFNMYLYTFTMEGYEKTYMGVVSQPIEEDEVAVYPTFFDYSTTEYSEKEQEAIYEGILGGWKE